MFYPKCPKCGGKTESAETTDYDRNGRYVGNALRSQAVTGHPHPYIKAAHLAMTVGNQIYKRWPGGGKKRCTVCAHEFN